MTFFEKNKHGAGQTKPVCGLELVQGLPRCNHCPPLCVGSRAVSWTATSLDFYIELHLHRVKFKSQFTWSCPECVSLGSQQDMPTECVSCLSTDLRLSRLPSQQFPHIGVPSPSPSGWLFISSGCAAYAKGPLGVQDRCGET